MGSFVFTCSLLLFISGSGEVPDVGEDFLFLGVLVAHLLGGDAGEGFFFALGHGSGGEGRQVLEHNALIVIVADDCGELI